jgi:hypothetical protein
MRNIGQCDQPEETEQYETANDNRTDRRASSDRQQRQRTDADSGFDDGFDIASTPFCNNGVPQCLGANGAQVFSAAVLIPDSISDFVISGLGIGDTVNFSLLASNVPEGTNIPENWSFTVVPEPTTAGMLGLGLLGLAAAGRRRS